MSLSAAFSHSLQFAGEHFTPDGAAWLYPGRMNIQVQPRSLKYAVPAHRARFHPRADILDEVVAGLLWMGLDLPSDASRIEMEKFAHHLVMHIRDGASVVAVEGEVAKLQSGQLCRRADMTLVRGLAQRAIMAVRGI